MSLQISLKDIGDRILLANAIKISLIFSRDLSESELGPVTIQQLAGEGGGVRRMWTLIKLFPFLLRDEIYHSLLHSNQAKILVNDEEHLR